MSSRVRSYQGRRRSALPGGPHECSAAGSTDCARISPRRASLDCFVPYLRERHLVEVLSRIQTAAAGPWYRRISEKNTYHRRKERSRLSRARFSRASLQLLCYVRATRAAMVPVLVLGPLGVQVRTERCRGY